MEKIWEYLVMRWASSGAIELKEDSSEGVERQSVLLGGGNW